VAAAFTKPAPATKKWVRVHALVVTIVHHPLDSRIRYRQIDTLLDAGWDVTYAAPFTEYGLEIADEPRIRHLDLPRAFGRRRLRALRAARSMLRHEASEHDVLLLHDPELLLTLPGLRIPPVVWDVHEDTAAAVTLKPWLPPAARPLIRWLVGRIERLAERRAHLILAEYAYQDRFREQHLVVPNVHRVPESVPLPDQPRVVYVGSVTWARGVAELVETARLVAAKTNGEVRTIVIGSASGDVRTMLREAEREGVLEWLGYVPSERAMEIVRGSIAGLSLLHDEPNYRVSLPTKVTDYIASGIPVVTTPLPLAREVVEGFKCGVVVPFADPTAAAAAVLELWADPERRRSMGASGHAAALEHYDWSRLAQEFVAELKRVAGSLTP
jgi:glycosyltransferase involved in cell wall biosynthesis